jgi:hypothetical protein
MPGRSRSPMIGVALEWHQTALPHLGGDRRRRKGGGLNDGFLLRTDRPGAGSCSTHDVENVFQFSVLPVAMPK